jgi:prolyl oligopeptidase
VTTELLKDFDALYHVVGNDGPLFYIRTDRDAPRGRLVAIDVRKPDPRNWQELLPQTDDTLETVSYLGGFFVAQLLKDARNVARVHDRKGALVREVELPGLGSTSGFGGKAADSETFFLFTGFTAPATVYRYDVKSGVRELFKAPRVDFDPAAYATTQVFYASKDGTRVPMFITHRKDLVLDGKRPTFLYGYGGFNISLSPWFSVSSLVWMELGGVYAVANIRGGNEYGEAWHQAGILKHKQNGFDDFIAAAEWLHANRYSAASTLAIGGGSNGGLLVGACMTQRPELYAAALPQVGVLDMLRYHTWTIGWAWKSDYGSSEDAELFPVLRAYSPYHNLKPGTRYPATLITTADHDDRVVPAHSFKFAAALQHAQAGDAPVLIRIETKAGHGAGKPTDKIIEETADRWAFVTRVLGMQVALPLPAGTPPAAGVTP